MSDMRLPHSVLKMSVAGFRARAPRPTQHVLEMEALTEDVACAGGEDGGGEQR